MARSLLILFFSIKQGDGAEVCEGPGILHDSELCRLHGQREHDWYPEHRIRCQPPVR